MDVVLVRNMDVFEWFMDIPNQGKNEWFYHNYLVDQFLVVYLFIVYILIDLDCHNLNNRIVW